MVIGRHEAGQWIALTSLVATTRYLSLHPGTLQWVATTAVTSRNGLFNATPTKPKR